MQVEEKEEEEELSPWFNAKPARGFLQREEAQHLQATRCIGPLP
jgi:hypothetical protein